jgi:UDP-glucuronate 4-epimerase
VGYDAVNSYYDPSLKEARLKLLANLGGDYDFVRANVADRDAVERTFANHRFDRIVHLAAQAGVRHSLLDPYAYVESNVLGFTTVLEACRHMDVPHLTYASTSSVYGANTKLPFSEHDMADHPLQFYAATKRANELMAHSYSHLFGLPTTGLRFFSVYGPWGRPDMALTIFARRILAGEPIDVFNNGHHTRSFTYVDDIADGVVRASDVPASRDRRWRSDAPDPSRSNAPFRILNIGGAAPVPLTEVIDELEAALGRKAVRNLLPLQAGDVPDSIADINELKATTGYAPGTPMREGIRRFVEWYRSYHGA